MKSTLVALLLATVLAWGESPALAKEPMPAPPRLETPACAVVGQHVVVKVSPATGATRDVRLWFRAKDVKSAHWVPASKLKDGSTYAVLPRPAVEETIVLFSEARTVGGDAVRGEPVELRAGPQGSCAAPELEGELLAAANAIVVGIPKGAPEIPAGFACNGVVSRLGDAGDLGPHDACARVRLAAAELEAAATSSNEGADDGTLTAITAQGGIVFHHNRPRRNPGVPPPPKPRVDNPRPISPVNP